MESDGSGAGRFPECGYVCGGATEARDEAVDPLEGGALVV
jgi:hypothetical protein